MNDLFPLNPFKGGLYQEFFNLEISESPTLLAESLRSYSRLMIDGGHPALWTQRKVPSSFRAALAIECGNPYFAVTSPTQLPKRYRSTSWNFLLAKLDDGATLEDYDSAVLVRMLTSLGLHHFAVDHFSAHDDTDHSDSEGALQLSNALARARFLKYKEQGPSYRAYYSPDDYWRLVEHAGSAASPAVCSAVFSLMLQYITETPDGVNVNHLAKVLRKQIDLLHDEFQNTFMSSLFYRGYALWPARLQRDNETSAAMDEADKHSRCLTYLARDEYEAFIARENRYSVLESRIKEFGARDDWSGARVFAEELYQLDALDCRALMSIAETYAGVGDYQKAAETFAKAAHCGPIYTATAWFMAGQCYDALGARELAAVCHLSSTEADAGAVSPLEALIEMEQPALSMWATQRLAAIDTAGSVR